MSSRTGKGFGWEIGRRGEEGLNFGMAFSFPCVKSVGLRPVCTGMGNSMVRCVLRWAAVVALSAVGAAAVVEAEIH